MTTSPASLRGAADLCCFRRESRKISMSDPSNSPRKVCRSASHIGNEYGIAGLKFSDLSRSGGPLEARKAREVGIVDIDQADRHTLRGEFEGSDIEIFKLFRRKQHKSAAPRSDAGDVVVEIEMRGKGWSVADPRRRLRTRRRQIKPVLQIQLRQVDRHR